MAATGIGRATATTLATRYKMKLALGDIEAQEIAATADAIKKAAGTEDVVGLQVDASSPESLKAFHDQVTARFGKDVALLFNNAGTGVGGGVLADWSRWNHVLSINGFGPIHGTREFLPAILEQGTPAAIINTGSKQGITTPPGNLAYNISKGMVKQFTEGLAHELRTNTQNPNVSAHLLVPGWVNTMIGIKTARHLGTEHKGSSEVNPAQGAWSPQQTVDWFLARLEENPKRWVVNSLPCRSRKTHRLLFFRFYLICPDNETTEEMDRKRVAWAAGDIVENRPALSRWHPDYAEKFKEYMAKPGL